MSGQTTRNQCWALEPSLFTALLRAMPVSGGRPLFRSARSLIRRVDCESDRLAATYLPLLSDSTGSYDRSMADPDLEAARARLRAERARLQAELDETVIAPGPMTYGSQAAAATQVFEQQRDLALRERAQNQLAQVDAALARIEEGTFGTCRRCGKDVAPERLEALPWAAMCIDCQRLEGRGR
jgi:DnaK suppressor protein